MKVLFSISLVVFCFSVFAQEQLPIAGTVKGKESKEELTGATIFLFKIDDESLAGGTVTDADGKFNFKANRGHYILEINYLGMEPHKEEVWLRRDVYLGTIYLEEKAADLNEVVVKKKAPQATVQGDTTSFDAKAYKTNANASAGDLVEKMPGMQKKNGELRAQGEKVQQVLVDGKSFFGQDPNAALSTLPAQVVDKIQVFDDQSEDSKASGVDDGTRLKTLNVVTKINMRNGEFGRVYGGYGSGDLYSAGGNINMFRGDQRISILGQTNNINIQNFSTEDLLGVVGDNSDRRGGRGRRGGSPEDNFMISPTGGITQTHAAGLNYQDTWGDKMEVTGSYFFNQGQNTTNESVYQRIYLPTSDQEYNESDSTESTNTNHKFNARLVYRPSPKATFYYIPRLSFQDNVGTSTMRGVTNQEGAIVNNISQIYNTDYQALNLSNRVMARFNGEKRGRSIFFEGQHQMSNQSGNSSLVSSNITPSDTNLVNQIADLESAENEFEFEMRASEPIGDNGLSAMMTYEVSNTTASTVQNTYSALSMVNVFDSSLSALTTTDWLANEVGLGIMKRSLKDGSFMMARMRFLNTQLVNDQALPTTTQVDKSFNALLPFLMYRKRFENKSSWFSMYRSRTSNPSADQLSNAIDNSNPLQLSSGNNELNQQYTHWAMSKYNFANANASNVFFATVNLSGSNSYIGQNTFTALQDTVINEVLLSQGSQFTKPENMTGYYSASSFITYGFPVEVLSSNLNVNFEAGFNQIPSIINSRRSNTQNQSYSLGSVLSSNISENIDFTISTESGYNISTNTLNSNANSNYLIQTSQIKYDWIMPMGFTFRTVLQHQQYFGLNDISDNSVLLWTAAVGKQLFKNKRGEIQLSAFDILNQNNRISQNFYDTYYEETTSNVLTRYLMLNFSYNIRNFRESDPGN